MMPSKGPKTSEFWAVVATGVVMLLNGTNHFTIPWDQFTIWMGVVTAYTGARTWEKVSAHKNGTGAKA